MCCIVRYPYCGTVTNLHQINAGCACVGDLPIWRAAGVLVVSNHFTIAFSPDPSERARFLVACNSSPFKKRFDITSSPTSSVERRRPLG